MRDKKCVIYMTACCPDNIVFVNYDKMIINSK
jgi:hypothetical protein